MDADRWIPIMNRWVAILLFALAASPVAGQDAALQFIAVAADGPRPAASLVSIDKKGAFHFDGATPFRIAAEDLVELRAATGKPPPFPRRQFALLANGDWLPLDPAGRIDVAEERVQLELASPLRGKAGPRLTLSQSALALVALQPPEMADDAVQAWADLRKLQPAHDLLLGRDGARLEGTLTGIDDRVRLRRDNRKVDVAVEDTAAVLFNSDLRAHPRLRQPHVQVTLRNGARLTLANLRLDAKRGAVAGFSPYGAVVEFPLEQLVHLQPHAGRVVPLSTLTPVRWRHTPFLDLVQPLTRDATRSGRPLEVGGGGHRHGLAMPCRGEATYRLGGAYRWFEATIGVHPADGTGRVRFSVVVDGKQVPVGTPVERRADDEPAAVRIDVTGVQTLTLISDFGGRGNVQSEAIWGSARLVR